VGDGAILGGICLFPNCIGLGQLFTGDWGFPCAGNDQCFDGIGTDGSAAGFGGGGDEEEFFGGDCVLLRGELGGGE